ncbi:hypothetical protein NN3_27250 [Nocardia neocaledoniensis NBRC 108232]|uniref:Uncharacterized protein n=1 Tax=Nocardia neocaledoniensis TaxID=236511 RepID=A0A317N1Q9_9NOCA|nr:hypothetical protein [Nocardia neocaledoniensis]PWV67834.1 hypothetical protein DFR69_1187 [Nocardia neocaledoniensis]GEM31718.1 hypothetical protein NN3_27250 [Nocardia neocaledoniensis NBRC 108232]
MNRSGVVWTAVIVVAALELLLVRMARDAVLLAVALPVAVALAMLIWSMRQRVVREEPLTEYIDNGPAEMLGRWHARASMLTARADGTRADWDRHLRPLLAKEFELSTGLRVAKNRRATEAAGQLQFGPELWRWVDPANSALRDQVGRAPGRAALDEILRRLQTM